jgi:hypothetical protein
MTERTETLDDAVAAARSRWRFIAIGLALVGATNIANTFLHVRERDGAAVEPVICIAAINDPALAKYAVEKRGDRQGGGFKRP